MQLKLEHQSKLNHKNRIILHSSTKYTQLLSLKDVMNIITYCRFSVFEDKGNETASEATLSWE